MIGTLLMTHKCRGVDSVDTGLVTPAPRETHYSAVCGDTGLGRDAAATDDNICYHWDISTSLMMPWPGNNSTKYGQIN